MVLDVRKYISNWWIPQLYIILIFLNQYISVHISTVLNDDNIWVNFIDFYYTNNEDKTIR